jgi:hypothetical protein
MTTRWPTLQRPTKKRRHVQAPKFDRRLEPQRAIGVGCRNSAFVDEKTGQVSGLRTSAAHSADLATRPASAVEETRAVRFEPAYTRAFGHLDAFEHRAALRIHLAQIGLFRFPGAVPQFAVDPGHTCQESVRFDGADDRARRRFEKGRDSTAAFTPGLSSSAAISRRPARTRLRVSFSRCSA